MRKILSSAIVSAICLAAQAQNVTDALRFSENDYFGTARSIAMGNAFTALGGDLGSAGINPAGMAVNSYSQIVFTPSVNLAGGRSVYSGDGYVQGWNAPYNSTSSYLRSGMNVPDAGVVMNFRTNRKRGVKTVSLGVVSNQTRYYNDRMSARGTNSKTSYMGYLADFASREGLSSAELDKASYWDMSPYYWPAMVAYRSGMINESGYGDYVGLAQGISPDGYPLLGDLRQEYTRRISGDKRDVVVNLSFNVSDRFYFGANLGITKLRYNSALRFRETAVDINDFPVLIGEDRDFFDMMQLQENYSASGSGIYGKFGFIAIPVRGLRIGAAIQTPAANIITEHLWYSGSTEFSRNSYRETVSERDEYIYDYRFISPMRAVFGIAYTFGKSGLISADYEICDYSEMRFKEIDNPDNSGFDGSNQSILEGAGVSHMIRIGAELNVLPSLALRGGYNFTTTPERYVDGTSGGILSPGTFTQVLSFGVGYRSRRSFFCDFAFRSRINPAEYIYPYPSYGAGESPEILNRSSLSNIVATFGWRF